MTANFIEERHSLQTRIQKIVDSQIGRGNVQTIALSLSTGSDSNAIHISSGTLPDHTIDQQSISENTPYFTASTSKLFATTLILQLVDEGMLSLDDLIVKFFPKDSLSGLHEKHGVDRTPSISVRQLMAHTSGIADYFEGKRLDGNKLTNSLLNNQDSSWSVTHVIDTVKRNMTPRFAPDTPRKAYYSDTNFQLLGTIIENVTQKTLVENIDSRVSAPLNLQNTYLFTQASIKERPAVLPLKYKQNTLNIPKAMESVRLDGGIVSNSADSLNFIQAFMQGKLFDAAHLPDMQQWNSIGFPLEAGVGILRFRLPKILTPFGPVKQLIGHSGISGAFAFYSPNSHVYLSGTLNQLHDQTLPYKFMLKVINAAKTK